MRASGQPVYIWGDEKSDSEGLGTLNWYCAAVSNNVPSNLVKGTSGAVCSALIFGNFNEMLIGQWGAMDITVNPYTDFAKGGVWVRGFLDLDQGLPHVASFAAIKDSSRRKHSLEAFVSLAPSFKRGGILAQPAPRLKSRASHSVHTG